jgi:hypothetical protein
VENFASEKVFEKIKEKMDEKKRIRVIFSFNRLNNRLRGKFSLLSSSSSFEASTDFTLIFLLSPLSVTIPARTHYSLTMDRF